MEAEHEDPIGFRGAVDHRLTASLSVHGLEPGDQARFERRFAADTSENFHVMVAARSDVPASMALPKGHEPASTCTHPDMAHDPTRSVPTENHGTGFGRPCIQPSAQCTSKYGVDHRFQMFGLEALDMPPAPSFLILTALLVQALFVETAVQLPTHTMGHDDFLK